MLKYIGNGFLVGVPMRDLTDDEVEKCGGEEFLIGTGLYANPDEGRAKPEKVKVSKKSEKKSDEDGE